MISVKQAKRLACPLLTAVLLVACLVSQRALAAGCAKPPTSPLVVNVRQKGAKGDGRTDDTAALRAAFDKVARTGGTVLVPDGVYMVEATSREHRLKIGSDTTLKLSPGAIIKAIPNGAHYLVIGRPITQAPDPVAALSAINASLGVFA